MNLFWATLIVVVVAALAITAMLFARRRAPEGSYFVDGDRARRIRRTGDRLRDPGRVRRGPGLPELRRLAQRRPSGGADRLASIRDGPAPSRIGARTNVRGSR